jgi:hypothetical protein
VRVLLVDDAEDSREVAAVILREAGAILEATASAREALEAFERATFDVIVSDIAMPETDGYDLLQMLQTKGRPMPPVVALTAYGRGEDRASALRAGFATHITKPIRPEELIASVARILRR